MKVSCVIPAYNESSRIKTVLQAVYQHPLVDEIIVVDDGSLDWEATEAIVAQFEGIRFLRNITNQGKTRTLVTAIRQISHELLLLLDADLIGLTANDLTQLLVPVRDGKVAMTISMRKNSPWIDRKLGIDFISGERVFHKALLEKQLNEIEQLSRFGFETFLNTLVMKNECSLQVIFWPNVESPYKVFKRGVWSGIRGEVGMVLDICRVVPFYTIPYMFYKMRTLMVPREK